MRAFLVVLVVLGMLAFGQRPSEIRLGIVIFLSGPASVFGVPAKNAADLLIDRWNHQGGVPEFGSVPSWWMRREGQKGRWQSFGGLFWTSGWTW